MAKDSFFIREAISVPDPAGAGAGTYNQVAIDLGAFVDALGKTILKVHRIEVSITDDASPPLSPVLAQGNNGSATVGWQLTTQSKVALVRPDDKSLISSGRMFTSNTATGGVQMIDDTMDINPSEYENGYLIAVEQIYLSSQGFNDFALGNGQVSVVLECTSETMTKDAAMALALSQQ